MPTDDPDTYRIRIWKGRNPHGEDFQGEPDEVVTVDEETTHVWQDDPHYNSSPLGIDVHPEDCPATLYIYTSDSVRRPPRSNSYVDESYWDGPAERGLPHKGDHDYDPFGLGIRGRVMFYVEKGNTRD